MSNVKALTRSAMIQALQMQGFVLVADVIAAGKVIQERNP